MRRIVIHAGTEKTGSTYLQSVFSANKKVLKKAGILYPKSGMESGHHYWIAKALGFRFKPGPVDAKIEQKSLDALKHEIAAWDGDILLSSEHFDLNISSETIGRLTDYFGSVNIDVVLVMRNQIDYSQSLYAEGLKWTTIRPYDKFLRVSEEQGRYSYLKRYKLWRESGAEVSIIDYELHKNGLLEAFLDQAKLGVDINELKVPAAEQNVSPSIDFLEMVRVCNAENEPASRRAFYESCFAYVARYIPELLEKRRFGVPEVGEGVFQRAEASNSELAELLGIERDDFLGGPLTKRLDQYRGYPEPDPLAGLAKFLPQLLKHC